MSIVTQQMLVTRLTEPELIRLTDINGEAIGQAAMAQAISEGESEILVNVGQKYTLPLSLGDKDTAALVRTKCTDAVVYRLYVNCDHRVDESIEKAYDVAIKWSEGIATGKLGLLGETQQEASPAAGGAMLIVGGGQTIDRDTMGGL